MTPTAADTETLTVRVRRGTAEELRRRAGGSGPELARLAGDLLDRSVAPDPPDPRPAALADLRRRVAESGATDDEIAAEFIAARREVRAQAPLRGRP